MTEVFAGIGSNINPETVIPEGIRMLKELFGPLQRSPVYLNPPVGFAGPDFLNLVIRFETDVEVQALLVAFSRIETACGRQGADNSWSSRSLDIDLLLYGNRVDETFNIPRPDILDYAFVLKPLSELAPRHVHPVVGRTYEDLWKGFEVDQPVNLVRVDLPEH